MSLLRQLLLIPLLAPLLAVLLMGALNPGPAISLRLLTWSSPALPLGSWLLLAAGGGGLLSALTTGVALRSGGPSWQRQVRRPAREQWEQAEEAAPPAPSGSQPSAGPTRSATEPSPTVAVPYRVIRRGSGGGDSQGSSTVQAEASAAAVDDDWNAPDSDDW